MEKCLTICLVLGGIAAATSVPLPIMPWTDDEISVMSLIGSDYYNKGSGEDAVYKLYGNNPEYITDEASRYHQLQFTIKETLCQKPDKKVTEECAFREEGLVKSCISSFFTEEDRDVIVVTCDNVHPDHTRVRRSKSGRGGSSLGSRGGSSRGGSSRGGSSRGRSSRGGSSRGRSSRGGRAGGRTGPGSSIAERTAIRNFRAPYSQIVWAPLLPPITGPNRKALQSQTIFANF